MTIIHPSYIIYCENVVILTRAGEKGVGVGGKRGYLPRASRYNWGLAVQNCIVLWQNSSPIYHNPLDKEWTCPLDTNSCLLWGVYGIAQSGVGLDTQSGVGLGTQSGVGLGAQSGVGLGIDMP